MRWTLSLLFLFACGGGSVDVPDGDADADTDADTDSDTDSDTDADTDTDTDADTDTDPVPDTSDDVNDLQGRSYLLDIGSGTFVQPAGIGPLLQSQIDQDLLLGVQGAPTTSIEILGALGDGSVPPAQDLCSPSIDFPVADFFYNPVFGVGPDDTTISVQGNAITIVDLFVEGSFSADGTTIQDTVLTGLIDTRQVVDLIQPGGADNAVCIFVALANVQCQPCPGGGNFCLNIEVTDLEATEVAGLTLVSRTEADIDADPDCAAE